jgi:hypothetical protein
VLTAAALTRYNLDGMAELLNLAAKVVLAVKIVGSLTVGLLLQFRELLVRLTEVVGLLQRSSVTFGHFAPRKESSNLTDDDNILALVCKIVQIAQAGGSVPTVADRINPVQSDLTQPNTASPLSWNSLHSTAPNQAMNRGHHITRARVIGVGRQVALSEDREWVARLFAVTALYEKRKRYVSVYVPIRQDLQFPF